MTSLTGHGPCCGNSEGPLIDQEIPGNLAEPEALGAYDTTSPTPDNASVGSFRSLAALTTLSDAAKATALVAVGLACVVVGGIVGERIPPIVIVVGGACLLLIGVLALVRP